jgi:hypothetical protein
MGIGVAIFRFELEDELSSLESIQTNARMHAKAIKKKRIPPW